MTIKTIGQRPTAAFDGINNFEKYFTSKYCGDGKIYHFLKLYVVM